MSTSYAIVSDRQPPSFIGFESLYGPVFAGPTTGPCPLLVAEHETWARLDRIP